MFALCVASHIMSSSLTIPEFVVIAFRSWAIEQRNAHIKASDVATSDMEKRVMLPIDSAATRLVHTWKTAVAHSKSDEVDDVNTALLATDIQNLLTYIQRNESSSTLSHCDIEQLRTSWVYYQTECARKCKRKFDSQLGSSPGFIKEFFGSVTLGNIFDMFTSMKNSDAYADFHENGYHIFWAMRARCGVVDLDDPLKSQRHDKAKQLSVDQKGCISNAGRNDKRWAIEYEQLASAFDSYGVDTHRAMVKVSLAGLQHDVGERFEEVIGQMKIVNSNSIRDHETSYDNIRDTGARECRSLVVASIVSQLNLILRFIDTPGTTGRAVSAYINHATTNAPKLSFNPQAAYAKLVQECELVSYSEHILAYVHDSLTVLTSMAGGLFPVPTGFSDEFTAVLGETVKLHTEIGKLDDTVVDRIKKCAPVDEERVAARTNMRNHYRSDVVAIDAQSYIRDVYANMKSRVESNTPIIDIRTYLVSHIAGLGNSHCVFEPHHSIGCTHLAKFESDAIDGLQLSVTSNADVMKQKRVLSVRCTNVANMWSDALLVWSRESDAVIPSFVIRSTNIRLTEGMILSDNSIKSIHGHIRRSTVQSYVDQFLEIAAEEEDNEEFGVQATILDQTFGTKNVANGISLGLMMRGIEVIMTSTTQAIVNQEMTKTISRYEPSVSE